MMTFGPKTRNSLRAGQHAVVTGGSSGLGLALSQRLAARGLRVTLVARNKTRLLHAVAVIRAETPSAEVEYLAIDVSDRPALDTAFAQMADGGRRIDVLVNSAGILREGYFEDLADQDFRDILDINFFGTLNAVRAALPMLKATRGRVINIASMAGLTGVFGYTAYSTSKHALVGFTNSLRYELQPQGVQVCLVCPGEFDSPMVDDLDKSRTPENRTHTLMVPKMGIDALADATLRGIDRGQHLVIPGLATQLLAAGQRYVPVIGDAIARHRIASVYRGPS